ncbi:Helix-turn-helix domain protein [compost metagenome]
MKYSDLLKGYIKNSRLTLEEICKQLEQEGLSMSREHLSRLQNGKTPPTSDELNRALAKITGGNAEELIMASFIEKAPPEVKKLLEEGSKQREASQLIRKLNDYIDYYLNFGTISDDILGSIHEIVGDMKEFDIDFYMLKKDPVSSYKSIIVKLTIYLLTQDQQPEKNNKDPKTMDEVMKSFMDDIYERSEIYRAAHNGMLLLSQNETDGTIKSIGNDIDKQTKDKLSFFTELESDLGLDLTDPNVQKKLKRAAKIIFSDED